MGKGFYKSLAGANMEIYVATSHRKSGDLMEWGHSEEIMHSLYRGNCMNPDYNDALLSFFSVSFPHGARIEDMDKRINEVFRHRTFVAIESREPVEAPRWEHS